eukprot:4092250-Pyramimonas_sp.AAC.1
MERSVWLQRPKGVLSTVGKFGTGCSFTCGRVTWWSLPDSLRCRSARALARPPPNGVDLGCFWRLLQVGGVCP